ncbi:MAG: sensor domain-containing diguanylate cyclase [Candidatus Omnitrophica bacterium]|nr:sensor domain-containing diguanylate cyclase [Candidatus Omnitrophota bacterium]
MPSLKHKTVLISLSIVLFITVTGTLIQIFGQLSSEIISTSFTVPMWILLFCCTFPILLMWIAELGWYSLFYVALSIILCLLTAVKTGQSVFLLYIVYCIALVLFLIWEHKRKKDLILMNAVDVEKTVEEKNILEEGLTGKAQALEAFLHSYTDYSNLSRVIDEFSSTLSLEKLCNLIVNNTLSVIGKGELILLYLVDLDENSLSLTASKSIDKKRRKEIKKGDIFDQWVLKNRQQLLVKDITKDVRFDEHLSNMKGEFKSLIITPLIYESRIVGTLHINSEKGDIFTTDDLRVLSIIGNIASAALSNAFLYQKTEELAIKDSLTGLFVHRYFKERLQEEYKRALLTNSSLTLLMGDLDDFKIYNDRYGHVAGDIILKRVSALFMSVIKGSGFIARYGGEEIAVLLPRTTKGEGIRIARKIRQVVEREKFELRGMDTSITMSMGVANIPRDTLDCEELIHAADKYLYEAKKRGKNQVVG